MILIFAEIKGKKLLLSFHIFTDCLVQIYLSWNCHLCLRAHLSILQYQSATGIKSCFSSMCLWWKYQMHFASATKKRDILSSCLCTFTMYYVLVSSVQHVISRTIACEHLHWPYSIMLQKGVLIRVNDRGEEQG